MNSKGKAERTMILITLDVMLGHFLQFWYIESAF